MSKSFHEPAALVRPTNDHVDGFYTAQLTEKVARLESQIDRKNVQYRMLQTKYKILQRKFVEINLRRTRVSAAIQIQALEDEIIKGELKRVSEINALKESHDHYEHICSNQIQRQSESILQLQDQLAELQTQLDHHAGLDTFQRELQLIQDYENAFLANNFDRPTPNYIKQMITDGITGVFISEHVSRPLTISKVVMELRRYRLDYNALIRIGIKASNNYFSLHGTRPRKYVRSVRGNAQVDVNIYFEDDRQIIVEAIEAFERENPNYSVF